MRFLVSLLFMFFAFGSFHVDGVVAVVGSRSILRSEVLEQSTMLAQQQNISPDKNPYQFQKVFDQVLKEKNSSTSCVRSCLKRHICFRFF